MKTNKLIVFSVLLLCVLIFFTSCYRPGTLGATGYYEAYVIAKNSVPFFIDIGDDASKFDKVCLLEKDEYGRSMYLYCSYNGGSRESGDLIYTTLLIICQLADGDAENGLTIGWYDQCWIVKTKSEAAYANFDDMEIAKHKEQNDWGKPLDNTLINTVYYVNGGKTGREQYLKEKADASAVCDAVIARYGDNNTVGSLIHRNRLIYTLTYPSNGNLRFICYDPDTEKIIKEQLFEGTAFNCRDAFNEFMK